MKRCCHERGMSISLIVDIARIFNGCDVNSLSAMEEQTLSLLVNNGVGEVVNTNDNNGLITSKHYQFNK